MNNETEDKGTEEVKIDKEDCLRLLLLAEKQRSLELQRQQVEMQKAILARENDDLVKALNVKYSVDLSGYALDTDLGIAKKQ